MILVQTTATHHAPLLTNDGKPHSFSIDAEVNRQLLAEWPNDPEMRARKRAGKHAIVEAQAIGAALQISDPVLARIQQIEAEMAGIRSAPIGMGLDYPRLAALQQELGGLLAKQAAEA